MHDERMNYVLVGSFVLAMVVGLVFALALLTGRTGATDTYYTTYEDVTGLKYGSQVLYMGFPVGQVEAIEPMTGEGGVSFRLALALDEAFSRWSVPRDSVAQVRAEGLLAAVAIDIRSGDSDEALRPGDTIRGATRRDIMAAMSETANTVRDLTVNSVAPLVRNLNRYVSGFGEVLLTHGTPLLGNLHTLSGELASRAPEVIDGFVATSTSLRNVSLRVERILSEENAGKVDGVMDNVLAASQDLAEATAGARGQLEALLADANLARVEDTLERLRTAAGDAEATGRSARAGVDALFSEPNLDHVRGALAAADAAAAGARDLVGPEQREQVTASVRSVRAATADLEALIAETRVRVREVLGPDTVGRFDRALENVATAAAHFARLSANLDDRLGDVLTEATAASVRDALGNFAAAAGNVATLSSDLRQSRAHLDRLLIALADTAEENRPAVDAGLRDLRYTLEVLAQYVDAVAANLEGTTRNLLELTRRLKSNPGLLLRGGAPEPEAGAGGGG